MKILVTGDFCPRERVSDLIKHNQTKEILKEFSKHINDSDLAITNLETAIISENHRPSSKIGINIGSSEKALKYLKNSGFGLVTLANNHFMDYGAESASFAMTKIKENGLEYIGAGNNEEEATHPFIFQKADVSVGIINACEHEFIGFKESAHCNQIDTVSLCNQIENLKKAVDRVVLIFHGGDEHSQIPRPNMVKLYRFLIKQGADVIINHHQHCYSGYERYNGGLVFYGLGNFCFDKSSKRKSQWNYGYAVKLDITKDILEFSIIPYNQCDDRPIVFPLAGCEKEIFNNSMAKLNKVISTKELLEEEYNNWVNDNCDRYVSYLSPYSNKYMRYMVRKGVLPSFIRSAHERILYLMNSCESHRDAINAILEKRISHK